MRVDAWQRLTLRLREDSPLWCYLVNRGASMKLRKKPGTTKRSRAEAHVRASISFPSERYALLEKIAKQKKVSLAWVVREAVDAYVSGK